MPIAIYRLKKLSVAMPIALNPNVYNHSRRQLRDLCLSVNPHGPLVRVFFTEIKRQMGLLMHYDEEWEFSHEGFHSIKRTLRNGRMIHGHRQHIPPAFAQFWVQKPMEAWVQNRIEDEQTSRCIIEQYLHEHVPNPDDYRIITFDFNVGAGETPTYRSHSLRPLDEVVRVAANDRSEDSHAWAQLFFR